MTLFRLPSLEPTRKRHRPGCTFGRGFYRVQYWAGGQRRQREFDEFEAAQSFASLLPFTGTVVQTDACADDPIDDRGDAMTPDVVDADQWLAMPRSEAMAELGLTTEDEYQRVARAIEAATYTRDNREAQGGIRVPIVIRRKHTPETDQYFGQGNLTRIRPIVNR